MYACKSTTKVHGAGNSWVGLQRSLSRANVLVLKEIIDTVEVGPCSVPLCAQKKHRHYTGHRQCSEQGYIGFSIGVDARALNRDLFCLSL